MIGHPVILEILYEPEAPWFKLITLSIHRLEVTKFIKKTLLTIGLEDVDELDSEVAPGGDGNERGEKEDVTIAGDTQRMVPWLRYEHGNVSAVRSFDELRFLELMRSMRHKAFCRFPSGSIDGMLTAASQSGMAREEPLSLNNIGDALAAKCHTTLTKLSCILLVMAAWKLWTQTSRNFTGLSMPL